MSTISISKQLYPFFDTSAEAKQVDRAYAVSKSDDVFMAGLCKCAG